MKYFTLALLLLLSMLIITSCDDRGSSTPTMEVTAADSFIYNKDNFNELAFEIQLDGPSSKLSNRKINIEVNDDLGYFIGNGHSNSVTTDDNGYAEGRFIAHDTTGLASIKFRLETWPSVHKDFLIKIIDLPKIDSLVATVTTLSTNGSSTSIRAYISSSNADLWGHNILFETDNGTLQYSEVETDEDGIAFNNIITPDEECLIRIKARLELNPNIYKSVNIVCQD
ncbi:MAG: hypothetical protein B6226_05635 [Candidatus Cloacimonetes bacterium 4572_65]|nr:MAG: hypothetical protein B6226_05635 [Candidatus Cloacimonetes bacterium 4572_65]